MVEIPPLVHVTGVAVIGDHRLRLLFEDGTVGDVDFKDDRRGDSRGRAGQQVADANRVDAVHGGMSAADPPVELGEGVEHLPTGCPQHSRQGMDP